MAIDRVFDVIVVGGGPAGSCTAGRLAKRGISVALLEEHHHPRYSVGESLLPQAWRFMDDLGVTQRIEEAGFVRKKGVTALWDGVLRQFEFSWFGYRRDPLIVDRNRFDELLFRHAASLGATAVEGARVVSIDTADDRSTVQAVIDDRESLSLSCRTVVDATGQSGFISRRHGLRDVDWAGDDTVFLWGYFRNSNFITPGGGVRSRSEALSGPIEATSYMCEIDGGWALQLPLRECSFVGFSAADSQLPQETPGRLEECFLTTLANIPNFDLLLTDAEYIVGSFRSLRNFSFCSSKFSGPGYFLVGDAAAYTDPIFAHGAQFAIYSAYSAANAIERTLRGGRVQAARLYDQQLRQHYEMSRAMARGRAGEGSSVHSSILDLLRWLPEDELNLLCTAAAVAGRSANFAWMADAAGIRACERIRILNGLQA